jgi:hypothetical protein
MAEHGTHSSYNHDRCRCDACREAHTDYQRRRRTQRFSEPIPDDVRHGVKSTYTNWGCRCDPCTAANGAHGAAFRRARRREATA